MEKNKKSFIISGCLFLLFIAFTIIVKYVDVHSIGPEGSLVGLATINNSFRNVLDYNELFYKISEILGCFLPSISLVRSICSFCIKKEDKM